MQDKTKQSQRKNRVVDFLLKSGEFEKMDFIDEVADMMLEEISNAVQAEREKAKEDKPKITFIQDSPQYKLGYRQGYKDRQLEEKKRN